MRVSWLAFGPPLSYVVLAELKWAELSCYNALCTPFRTHDRHNALHDLPNAPFWIQWHLSNLSPIPHRASAYGTMAIYALTHPSFSQRDWVDLRMRRWYSAWGVL